MDAVLPLRLSGSYRGQDLDRARILLHSLEHAWADPTPLRIIVIAPEQDVEAIRAALVPRRLRLVVVRETLLLPALPSLPEVEGWYRQMALKLAAHVLVRGPFYLTLDADLVAVQPISPSLLLPEGRALTQWERRDIHAAWWEGSAAALGMAEWRGPAKNTPGLSVTPALLSTRIAAALQAALHAPGGAEAWMTLLRRPGLWSEYSLYTLLAEREGLLEAHHHDSAWMRAHPHALRSRENIWFPEQVEAWNPAPAFAPRAAGLFMICQSRTRIPPRHIWEKLAPHIPGSPF
jgi:hypothetical protein